jgi:hypothetical protein
MVENGNAAQMFRPVDDMFADDSRAAMRDALQSMSREEAAEWLIGDDRDHPYADLKEAMIGEGDGDEYGEFIKNFVMEDFMVDVWGDRATRDVMEAAGAEDWDDPEARAKYMEEAKRTNAPQRQQVALAMDRIREAQRRGDDPDDDDVAIVRDMMGTESPKGLVGNVRALLTSLKDKFKGKRVVSPATAVLENFAETGDVDVMEGETLPHVDEKAPPHRSKAEREQARAEREALEVLEQRHGPADKTKIQRERIDKAKKMREQAAAKLEGMAPEQRAKAEKRLEQIDAVISKAEKAVAPKRGPAPQPEPEEDDFEAAKTQEMRRKDVEPEKAPESAKAERGKVETVDEYFEKRERQGDKGRSLGNIRPVRGGAQWRAIGLDGVGRTFDDELKAKSYARSQIEERKKTDAQLSTAYGGGWRKLSPKQREEKRKKLRENPDLARKVKRVNTAFDTVLGKHFGEKWDDLDQRDKLMQTYGETPSLHAAVRKEMQRLRAEEGEDEPDEPDEPGGSPGRPPRGDEDNRRPGETWQTKSGWYGKAGDGKVYGPFNSQEEAQRGIRPGGGGSGAAKRVTLPKGDERSDAPRLRERRLAAQWLATHRSERVAGSWLAHVRSVHPDDPNRPIVVIEAA